MGADPTQPIAEQWQAPDRALNGGVAVIVPTIGTYVSVSTGIGARALCYLKIQNVSGMDATITVRDADESGDWGHLRYNNASGASRFLVGNDQYSAVVVPCNALGNFGITSDQANSDWKIWLTGYVKQMR